MKEYSSYAYLNVYLYQINIATVYQSIKHVFQIAQMLNWQFSKLCVVHVFAYLRIHIIQG